MIPLIRCGFGIGNRVAAIANALSCYPEIQFVWRNSPPCPVNHEDVFPNGLPGVEFVTDAPTAFATRLYSKHIEAWDAAVDRELANSAYAMIFSEMAGKSHGSFDCAIIARFLRYAHINELELAELAAKHEKQVFILSDSRRASIANHLQTLGCRAEMPKSPEMASEKDRAKQSLIEYLSDWKTAISAKTVITHIEDTSTTYPARAIYGENVILTCKPKYTNLQQPR